jgi:hypothetical protein
VEFLLLGRSRSARTAFVAATATTARDACQQFRAALWLLAERTPSAIAARIAVALSDRLVEPPGRATGDISGALRPGVPRDRVGLSLVSVLGE